MVGVYPQILVVNGSDVDLNNSNVSHNPQPDQHQQPLPQHKPLRHNGHSRSRPYSQDLSPTKLKHTNGHIALGKTISFTDTDQELNNSNNNSNNSNNPFVGRPEPDKTSENGYDLSTSSKEDVTVNSTNSQQATQNGHYPINPRTSLVEVPTEEESSSSCCNIKTLTVLICIMELFALTYQMMSSIIIFTQGRSWFVLQSFFYQEWESYPTLVLVLNIIFVSAAMLGVICLLQALDSHNHVLVIPHMIIQTIYIVLLSVLSIVAIANLALTNKGPFALAVADLTGTTMSNGIAGIGKLIQGWETFGASGNQTLLEMRQLEYYANLNGSVGGAGGPLQMIDSNPYSNSGTNSGSESSGKTPPNPFGVGVTEPGYSLNNLLEKFNIPKEDEGDEVDDYSSTVMPDYDTKDKDYGKDNNYVYPDEESLDDLRAQLLEGSDSAPNSTTPTNISANHEPPTTPVTTVVMETKDGAIAEENEGNTTSKPVSSEGVDIESDNDYDDTDTNSDNDEGKVLEPDGDDDDTWEEYYSTDDTTVSPDEDVKATTQGKEIQEEEHSQAEPVQSEITTTVSTPFSNPALHMLVALIVFITAAAIELLFFGVILQCYYQLQDERESLDTIKMLNGP